MGAYEEQEHEADPLDVAARNTQIMIDDNIRAASQQQRLVPTGFCLSPDCGEQLEDDRRFCNADCRNRYDHHQRMREINGRVA